MVKGIFIGILIGAVAWQGVAAIADHFGGGEVGEAVGCGVFTLILLGILKIKETFFKKQLTKPKGYDIINM